MRKQSKVRGAVIAGEKPKKKKTKRTPSPTKFAGSKPKSKKPKANVYTSRRK